MEFNELRLGVLAIFSAIGAAIGSMLGGLDNSLQLLLVLMAVDYVTGLLVAGVWHKSPKSEGGKLDSRAGFKGLVKKGVALAVILVAVKLDEACGSNYCRMAAVLFFCGNEGISLLENLGLMGVPYPAILKNMLEALKQKGEDYGNH